MKPLYWILKDKTPIPTDRVEQWAIMMKGKERIVSQTSVRETVWVSTVFLGLDHSFGEGPPLLFETMIFGGEHDQSEWRYSTWDEALVGHKAACELAAG